MSGRVRVDLPDGRRVTGYRKTLRQNPHRTAAHETPELRLVFLLPPMIAWAVSPGPYLGTMKERVQGVTVGPLNDVIAEARTFNRNIVFARAASFLRAVTPDGHQPYSVSAVLTSSSDPKWSAKWRLAFVDGHVLAALTPIDTLIYPAAV